MYSKSDDVITQSANILEAVIDGVGEKIGRRVNRYARAKATTMEFLKYLEGWMPAESPVLNRLYGCAQNLEFHRFKDTGKSFLVAGKYGAKFCSLPILCQVDAIRKAASRLRAVFPRLVGLCTEGGLYSTNRAAFERYKESGSQRDYNLMLKLDEIADAGPLRASMATMTQRVDAEASPRELVNRMHEHWSAWRNAARWRTSQSELKKVLGGVWQYELAYSEKFQGWHVHAHGVWVHAGYLDYKKIQSEYSERLGYSAQFNIELLKACELRRDGKVDRDGFDQQLLKDLCEVVKYPLKFHELPFDKRWEAYESLCGTSPTRLTDSFGLLRGTPEGEICPSDEGKPEGDNYQKLIFIFADQGYKLDKINSKWKPEQEVPF